MVTNDGITLYFETDQLCTVYAYYGATKNIIVGLEDP